MDIPQEIARREDRLKVLATAKEKIDHRAQKRFEDEQAQYQQAQYQQKRDNRERQKKTGKKPRGPAPKPPKTGPKVKGQGSKIKLI